MLVVQSPDKQVQTHKFIFKSLSYMIKEAMENLEPTPPLSMLLHEFAGKALGSRFVISRPILHMARMFSASSEFKTLANEADEKGLLGQENWVYMQNYGIGDTRYKMVYREITPEPVCFR